MAKVVIIESTWSYSRRSSDHPRLGYICLWNEYDEAGESSFGHVLCGYRDFPWVGWSSSVVF